MPRFPSFDTFIKDAAATFGRFPLALASALFGTMAAFQFLEDPGSDQHIYLTKLIIVAALGLPLFISLTVFSERRNLSRAISIGLQVAGVALLLGYYLSLPENLESAQSHFIRFALLNLGLHFLVSVLPFVGKGQTEVFWRFNHRLFLRFLTAAVYSVALYAGLAIAMAAVDNLFGVDIAVRRYMQLWVIIAGTFNTWLFLAGVPRDYDQLAGEKPDSRGLLLFSRYILLPLVVLYYAILLAFTIKILITWSWPKGWVSNLVLWYSAVGILSLLLLHQYKDKADYRWIQIFSRWFFRALVPMIVLLFFAIARRISDYGVTEGRYLVVAMAIGLLVVACYFIISKTKDIRIIPAVLCILAFLSAYGPWSSFAISRWSQMGRLETYMTDSGYLKDGVLQSGLGEGTFEQRKEMSNIVNYLGEFHGVETFARWLPKEKIDSLATKGNFAAVKEITQTFGFEFVGPYMSEAMVHSYDFHADQSQALATEPYDYFIDLDKRFDFKMKRKVLLGEQRCDIYYDRDLLTLHVDLIEDSATVVSSAVLSLRDPLTEIAFAHTSDTLPIDLLTFQFSNDDIDAKAVLVDINGQKENDSITVSYSNTKLFLRLKE